MSTPPSRISSSSNDTQNQQQEDGPHEDMKQNYIFTWKALGLLFIIFLTVGVCLASISGTQTQSEEATSEAASTDAPTLEVENTAELIKTAQETNLVANKLATDTMVYLPYVTHNESPEPSADCGGLIQEAEAGRFYGDMRVGSDNGCVLYRSPSPRDS